VLLDESTQTPQFGALRLTEPFNDTAFDADGLSAMMH
jgi:hypothetical protein